MFRKILSKIPFSWILYVKSILFPKEYIILRRKDLTYATDNLYTRNNADFMADPRFVKAYAYSKALGQDLMPPAGMEWRVYVMCWLANSVIKLPGDFVACGVYTGFCDRAIIEYTNFQASGKTYFLLDTFQGLDTRFSSKSEVERYQKYKKRDDLYERVQETFKDFSVKIIKGSVPETLQLVQTDQISFLSVDMNTALPERQALDFFWDKITPGGIILLDDYGSPGCLHQKSEHDDFAKRHHVEILTLPTCQGVIFKPLL